MSHEDDNDVAIIGVSFELPGHTDWKSLACLFRSGTDRVGPMPTARARETGVDIGPDDQHGAWLDHITGFDTRYFGVSRADAEMVDPRQRRMLHLAVAALGDAGYAPSEVRGRDVAVVVAAYGGIEPTLRELLPDDRAVTGPAIIGSMRAYASGRVSYHLDLRGAATMVDTACSSFLVALHEARWKLARGEHELALVGGYEVILGPPPRRASGGDGLGVRSAGGRCRPFDVDADGTTFGEGGGFVVLKRLSDARRDGDTVHAVIRGSAVNQDAGRAGGLTSPSPAGQAEVLVKAWRDAGIGPADLGYLEAHGTATRIGDPIELQGIGLAIAEWSAIAGRIPISSVKGNFGHLDCMAGFAGLLRVITQFRVGEVFPTAHFRAVNPLADLDSTPVRIADRVLPWVADGPRVAGISSFGLSGTNAHVVVEEGTPAQGESTLGENTRPSTVVVSAPDRAGLHDLVARLRVAVEATGGAPVVDLARQLAVGREHFRHRAAWVVRDRDDLLRVLAVPPDDLPPASPPPVVLAMGGEGDEPAADELVRWADSYRGCADVIASACAVRPSGTWSAAERSVVRVACLRALVADLGVVQALVLTHGSGTTAAAFGHDGGDPRPTTGSATPPDPDRLGAALATVPAGAVVLDLAPGSALSTALHALRPAPGVLRAGTPEELLRELHLAGFDLDWRAALPPVRRRWRLPVARLLDEHCWPQAAEPGTAPAARDLDVAEQVLELVRAVLKEPGTTLADDFFAVGGDSLNGVLLVNRINEHYGIDLDVLDLFDQADLAELAKAVEAGIAEAGPPAVAAAGDQSAAADPDPLSEPLSGPLSGQQTAIWAASQLSPGSNTYNVAEVLLFDGTVDPDVVQRRLAAMVRRHPALRTVLRDDEDGVRQVVLPHLDVVLERMEVDLTGLLDADGRDELTTAMAGVIEPALSPYDRALRAQLVRARFADTERDVLALTVHHLFGDGWSWRVLLEELEHGDPGSTPARSHFDHVRDQAAALAGDRGRVLERFWADYLAGLPEVALPADHEGSAAVPGAGEVLPLPLGPDMVDRLGALARQERATVNMVLLAAWAVLLWKITGVRDQCVAIPVNGRKAGYDDVVGCFVNTVVVRVEVRPDEPFTTFLADVRRAQLAAVAHADLPTDRIVRLARPNSTAMLAETDFSYYAGVEAVTRLGGTAWRAETMDVDPAAPAYPITVSILEYGAEIRAHVKYAADRFRRDTVEAWLADFGFLLAGLARGEDESPIALFDDGSPAEAVALPDFQF